MKMSVGLRCHEIPGNDCFNCIQYFLSGIIMIISLSLSLSLLGTAWHSKAQHDLAHEHELLKQAAFHNSPFPEFNGNYFISRHHIISTTDCYICLGSWNARFV